MINTLQKHKLTGIYVLCAGFLARYALGGPRAVGFHDYLIDFAVVGFAAIVAGAATSILFEYWREGAEEGNNSRLTAAIKRKLGKRWYITALVAAVVVMSLIALYRGDYLPWPFRLVLFLVSVPCSIVTDSFHRASSI
ncbi:hypothetical protein AJ87_26860 [Rhizobium yanglingense]|nr:hypothetical protein AJ87_26860 [Rhizobium yanglingense]